MGTKIVRKEHCFIDGIEKKECSRCNRWLDLSMYNKDKSKWDGLHGFCKDCKKKIDREIYRKDPDKKCQKVSEYQKRTGLISKSRPYNPDYYKSPKSRIKKQERDKRRRMLVKYANKKERITDVTISILKEKYGNKCAYCGNDVTDSFEIEHKLPLFRGGQNNIDNLALSCESCNRKKGKKTDIEFVGHSV